MPTATLRLALLAAFLTAIPACSAPARLGQGGPITTYRLGTLTTTLDASLPVPALAAAAQRVLDARGLTTTGRTITGDRAGLRARSPAGRLYEEYDVRIAAVGAGTQVDISAPNGGRAACEYLLRDVLGAVGIDVDRRPPARSASAGAAH